MQALVDVGSMSLTTATTAKPARFIVLPVSPCHAPWAAAFHLERALLGVPQSQQSISIVSLRIIRPVPD